MSQMLLNTCDVVKSTLSMMCTYPKTVLAISVTSYGFIKLMEHHRRLYNQQNPFEYIPTEKTDWLLVRQIRNVLKHQYAAVKYQMMTVGGLYQTNVKQLSEEIEMTIIRKPDLRPTLVPNGDSIDIIPVNSMHSHPVSAQYRSSANTYLNECVLNAGYRPYNISKSRRDVEKGCRYFYHSKDLSIKYSDDKIEDQSVFIMTDVDYYVDMPRWLKLFRPIVMYTLSPTRLSCSGPNNKTEYRFNIDGNVVHYHVSGGGEYTHQLWNYTGDTVTCVDDDGNLLTFDIEQRMVKGDEQHRLIWLLPRSKVVNPLWHHLRLDWENNVLKRKDMTLKGFNYLLEPIEDNLSIGLIGTKYSVEIPGKLYEAIRIRLAEKEATVFVSDVERMLKEAKHPSYVTDAPILFKCFAVDVVFDKNVVKTSNFAVTYQAIPRYGALSTEDGNNPGQTTTSPLTSNPALTASKGYNADKACIEGRIDKVANNVKWSKVYKDYAREFIDLLVPKRYRGTGTPISIGEVDLKQDKVAQRGRFQQVAPMMSIDAGNAIKAFIKTEAYAAAKPPRNISTMSPELTIQMSAYTLVFADILKTHDWYCPGKKPRDIIKRLAHVMKAEEKEDVEEGDYTCLDGTQSEEYARRLLLPAYMQYLAPEHRTTFRDLYKKVYKQHATTSTGIAYDPGYSVRSGSPITTQAGTIANAFNVYSALRHMGYVSEDAFSKIGAIFGDDSCNPNYKGLFTSFIEQVAKDLGMIYKSNLRPRGEPLLFLGRYFVDPPTTDDSYADPLRTIGKLHVSTNKSVTKEQAAANKALGYISTDRLTPIIGTWAARVIQLTKIRTMKGGTHEEQYKCSNAWPQKNQARIRDCMATTLGMTIAELIELDNKVKQVDGLDHFPVVFDTAYKHTQVAVVDGDLVCTDLHQEPVPIQDESEPKAGSPSVQSPTPTYSSCATQTTGGPKSRSTKRRFKAPGRRAAGKGHPDRIRPNVRQSNGVDPRDDVPRSDGRRIN